MRERPIPFSGPMVRAILDGRKTVTRRIAKLPHNNRLGTWEPTTVGGQDARGIRHPDQAAIWHTRTGDTITCPYGQPGDRLWVREAWRSLDYLDKLSGSAMAEKCLDAGYRRPWAPIHYEADGAVQNWEHTGTPPHEHGPKLAAIAMPASCHAGPAASPWR